ncbi:DUF2207 family protein [Actinoalloteichus caeruleus]|uniref:DUF2207 family protein n=1 Tax=Actinoalloteichus cyanogriseus TaxID=2893586 RepID=UPI0004AAE31C|nr:DUF2207 domain-containing protein [Actinoalloteichus caeruleus]
MLTNWGLTASALMLAGAAGLGAPAPAQAPPGLPGTVSAQVDLRLERDGSLMVVEHVLVPDGMSASRAVPLRLPSGEGLDRVFEVRDPVAEGAATLVREDDGFGYTAEPGESTVRYTVDGAVADAGAGQEAYWRLGGWDVPVDSVTISFVSPTQPRTITCLAGPPGTSTNCTVSQLDVGQPASAREIGVEPGDRIDLTVGLEPGTTPATARFEETFDLARAFSLHPGSAAGLGVVLALTLGAVGWLFHARRRDALALARESDPVEVLVAEEGGGVGFASPDGVLPGQVGTVVDEHVDVVDVTATVVDLAVRNYLWIEELHVDDGVLDWRIVRRNEPDEALHPYELAVYEALLGGGGDRAPLREVRLSDWRRGGQRIDLARVRDELYDDVVRQHWFSVRPDRARNRWWWAGAALSTAGVAATAVLVFTTDLALVGLGVLAAGVVVTALSRWIPSRTRRGRDLVAQVRGLRQYLDTVPVSTVPPEDREVVFSRSLPYAVVLGETDRWLTEFASVDVDADGTPGLYWYGEDLGEDRHVTPDLDRFATHFPSFLAELDGVLAESGHLRSLR